MAAVEAYGDAVGSPGTDAFWSRYNGDDAFTDSLLDPDEDDRTRRPSVQGAADASIGPAPFCHNLRSVLAALALVLTFSLHLGYALGHGPACAGQIFESLLAEERQLLRVFCLTSVFLGAFLGAGFGGLIGQRSGRRTAMLASVPPAIIGWCLWSLARAPRQLSLGLLISGRMLVGIGAGMASVIVPVYIAEIAPARMRGALTSLHQFGIGLGFTLAYAVGWNAVDAVDSREVTTCVPL